MAKLLAWLAFAAFNLAFLTGQPPSQSVSLRPATVQATAAPDPDYPARFFASFERRNATASAIPAYQTGTTGWVLAIIGTFFYGDVALATTLWILFSSDWVGWLTAFLLTALCLAFVIPRRPRPIALFVLACLNLVLAAGVSLVIAFSEPLPPVLISLVPVAGLAWLAFRYLKNAAKSRKIIT